MLVQPGDLPTLASSLLFREEKFFPESLPPCPPAPQQTLLYASLARFGSHGYLLAIWKAGKQVSGFFSLCTGRQARQKGTREEQPTKSVSTVPVRSELGLHGQADT